jgi:hypothetical protein
MTERHNAFIVILEHDIRDDDAQDAINAIKQIKGVLDVKPADAATPDVVVAESRVRIRIWDKIRKVFEEEFKQ